MASNRVKRFEFEAWEPMDQLAPRGLNGKAPRRYTNAAFDAGGALSRFGATCFRDSTDPPGLGTTNGFLLDFDDTGLCVTVPNQDANDATWTVTEAAPRMVSGADCNAATGESLTMVSGTNIGGPSTAEPALGLYEGVGIGGGDFASVFLEDGTSIFQTPGSFSNIASATAVAQAATGSGLAAGSYFVYVYSFVPTAGGLFLLGHERATVTIAADQRAHITVAWPDVPTDGVVYVYLRQGSKPNPIYAPPLLPGAEETPPTVSVEGDAYLVGTGTDGATFDIDYDPVGTTLPDRAFASTPSFFVGTKAHFGALPAVAHQGRYYNFALGMVRRGGEVGDTSAAFIGAENIGKGGRLIAFSDTGYVNFGSASNWFVVPFRGANATITGLLSSPAGLLIFSQDEIYLMAGDPGTGDFALQLVSGGLGSDSASPNLRPRRMGGTVLFVHGGRLMAYTLGMGDVDFGGALVEVSKGLYDPDLHLPGSVNDAGAIHQFAPVPSWQAVAVVGANGSAFFYKFDSKHWTFFEPREDLDVQLAAKSYTLVPVTGSRYTGVAAVVSPWSPVASGVSSPALGHWGTMYGLMHPGELEGGFVTQVLYNQIDLGDRSAWKTWLYIEVNYAPVPGYPLTPNTEGVNAQSVFYTLPDGSTGVILLEEETTSDTGLGVMRGYFPPGTTSQWVDLRFTFTLNGMDRVRPGWAIYAVPRSRAR